MRIRTLLLALLAVPAVLPAANAQDYVTLGDGYVDVNLDGETIIDDVIEAPYATTGHCVPITITAWVSWPGTTVWAQTTFDCGTASSGGGNCHDTRGDTQYETCDRGIQHAVWDAQTWDGYAWRDLGASVVVYMNGNTPTCDTSSYGPHPSRTTPTHGCGARDVDGRAIKVKHRAYHG